MKMHGSQHADCTDRPFIRPEGHLLDEAGKKGDLKSRDWSPLPRRKPHQVLCSLHRGERVRVRGFRRCDVDVDAASQAPLYVEPRLSWSGFGRQIELPRIEPGLRGRSGETLKISQRRTRSPGGWQQIVPPLCSPQ